MYLLYIKYYWLYLLQSSLLIYIYIYIYFKLKLLKSYLWSTTSQKRLNKVDILSIDQDLLVKYWI